MKGKGKTHTLVCPSCQKGKEKKIKSDTGNSNVFRYNYKRTFLSRKPTSNVIHLPAFQYYFGTVQVKVAHNGFQHFPSDIILSMSTTTLY